MLYLLAEISLFLIVAGFIGLLTGLFLHRELSSLGTQATIENWRARLSRSESKHHLLQAKSRELAGQIRDQEAELAASARRLQLAKEEARVLGERLEKAKIEVKSQWNQAERAEESRKKMEEEWQAMMEIKSEEAETLAAALRDEGSATKVTTSEQFNSLKQMLAERDLLIAMLQRRLQSIELQMEQEAASVPSNDFVVDMDRSLFLYGDEEEATEQTQEIVDLAGQIPTEDLTRIRGLGAATEKRLNELGIRTYQQIAAWSESEVDEWSERLETAPDLIRELAWVEQAKALLK